MGRLSFSHRSCTLELNCWQTSTSPACRARGAGGIVFEDGVRQVLGRGQLAPHGGILAPVVVVTDEDNLAVVREELVVGAGVDDIFRRIGHEGGGIATGARFQGLGPGLLDDIVGAEVGSDQQGVDSLAVIVQLWP